MVQLIEHVYGVLGITDHWYRLSLWDPTDTEKYVDNPEMWERGERYLKDAMAVLGLDYVEAPGEAAFYGPKIDIQLRDPLGHSETISTIQVDFHLPNQFGLEYVGEDGQFHRPVMVHRGVIGTLVADDRVPDRKIWRCVPALAGAGTGGGDPNCRSAPGIRGGRCVSAALWPLQGRSG